ncbi:Transcriptional regulators of sugar metabolism [Butyrivibrio fibrisolvens 16/4]|nr:Transcriptional regulators of sugar metabolism [Butyrivibrio fibrisolvens 16/4]
MLASERQNYILEELKKNGGAGVSVEELAEALDVSLMTIRRDLQKMSEAGQLERCHGGAIMKNEVAYIEKATSRSDEKNAIAEKAASLINDGDCVFLDAGTTTFKMLKYLENRQQLTIVTNDLEIGYQAYKMNFDVIMCGGKIQKSTACMFGMMTNDAIRQIKFDYAFLGAASIDERLDVLTPTEAKAVYKRLVVENSNYSYLLVDSSKFNKRAIMRINNLSDYTGVITTYKFDKEEKNR